MSETDVPLDRDEPDASLLLLCCAARKFFENLAAAFNVMASATSSFWTEDKGGAMPTLANDMSWAAAPLTNLTVALAATVAVGATEWR